MITFLVFLSQTVLLANNLSVLYGVYEDSDESLSGLSWYDNVLIAVQILCLYLATNSPWDPPPPTTFRPALLFGFSILFSASQEPFTQPEVLINSMVDAFATPGEEDIYPDEFESGSAFLDEDVRSVAEGYYTAATVSRFILLIAGGMWIALFYWVPKVQRTVLDIRDAHDDNMETKTWKELLPAVAQKDSEPDDNLGPSEWKRWLNFIVSIVGSVLVLLIYISVAGSFPQQTRSDFLGVSIRKSWFTTDLNSPENVHRTENVGSALLLTTMFVSLFCERGRPDRWAVAGLMPTLISLKRVWVGGDSTVALELVLLLAVIVSAAAMDSVLIKDVQDNFAAWKKRTKPDGDEQIHHVTDMCIFCGVGVVNIIYKAGLALSVLALPMYLMAYGYGWFDIDAEPVALVNISGLVDLDLAIEQMDLAITNLDTRLTRFDICRDSGKLNQDGPPRESYQIFYDEQNALRLVRQSIQENPRDALNFCIVNQPPDYPIDINAGTSCRQFQERQWSSGNMSLQTAQMTELDLHFNYESNTTQFDGPLVDTVCQERLCNAIQGSLVALITLNLAGATAGVFSLGIGSFVGAIGELVLQVEIFITRLVLSGRQAARALVRLLRYFKRILARFKRAARSFARLLIRTRRLRRFRPQFLVVIFPVILSATVALTITMWPRRGPESAASLLTGIHGPVFISSGLTLAMIILFRIAMEGIFDSAPAGVLKISLVFELGFRGLTGGYYATLIANGLLILSTTIIIIADLYKLGRVAEEKYANEPTRERARLELARLGLLYAGGPEDEADIIIKNRRKNKASKEATFSARVKNGLPLEGERDAQKSTNDILEASKERVYRRLRAVDVTWFQGAFFLIPIVALYVKETINRAPWPYYNVAFLPRDDLKTTQESLNDFREGKEQILGFQEILDDLKCGFLGDFLIEMSQGVGQAISSFGAFLGDGVGAKIREIGSLFEDIFNEIGDKFNEFDGAYEKAEQALQQTLDQFDDVANLPTIDIDVPLFPSELLENLFVWFIPLFVFFLILFVALYFQLKDYAFRKLDKDKEKHSKLQAKTQDEVRSSKEDNGSPESDSAAPKKKSGMSFETAIPSLAIYLGFTQMTVHAIFGFLAFPFNSLNLPYLGLRVGFGERFWFAILGGLFCVMAGVAITVNQSVPPGGESVSDLLIDKEYELEEEEQQKRENQFDEDDNDHTVWTKAAVTYVLTGINPNIKPDIKTQSGGGGGMKGRMKLRMPASPGPEFVSPENMHITPDEWSRRWERENLISRQNRSLF